jgi:hypothetical protein
MNTKPKPAEEWLSEYGHLFETETISALKNVIEQIQLDATKAALTRALSISKLYHHADTVAQEIESTIENLTTFDL